MTHPIYAFALAICLPASATAWSFEPQPICTLMQTQPGGTVEVTFDPAGGLYALYLTRPGGWPLVDIFAIRFDGLRSLTITTDRHQIDGDRLSVTDSGFGNVLDGLQASTNVTALIGDQSFAIDVTGIDAAMDAFRRCPEIPSV